MRSVSLLVSVVALGLLWQATRTDAQSPPVMIRQDPISFRDVVKTVLPAVVSIESKTQSSRGNRSRRATPDGEENFRKFFEELERRQNEGPPGEQTVGFGSGYIVDTKGIVLTNNHVVEGADYVEITMMDGRKFTSKDIKGDSRTDLAIVRIDPKGSKLPWLEFGDSNQMEIGDRVLAIGAPFGLSGSVTHGIISAKSRDLNLNRYDDFIQTDAAINPGNSGGPLVNLDGKVVGINSAIKSRTGGFQGVSMAISSNLAKSVYQALVRDGVVKRPYIGIEAMLNTSSEVLSAYGLDHGGVIIGKVRDRSPALKGGLQADDAIAAINGKAIKDIRDLQRTIASQPVGETIKIDILRNGKPMTATVKLEEEPENYGLETRRRVPRGINIEGDGIEVEGVGMSVATVSAAQAEQRGLAQKGGAVITAVEAGSYAQRSGLSPGLVITKVNRKPVLNAAEAKKAIEESAGGDGALLHVQLNDAQAVVLLKIR
jgi:serine protease Do